MTELKKTIVSVTYAKGSFVNVCTYDTDRTPDMAMAELTDHYASGMLRIRGAHGQEVRIPADHVVYMEAKIMVI